IGSPSMNFIPVTLTEENGRIVAPLTTGDDRRFAVPVTQNSGELKAGRNLIMGIRPENLTDFQEGMQNWEHITPLSCTVKVVEPTGPDTLVYVEINQTEIVCRACPDCAAKAGEKMRLALDTTKPFFFDPQTGLRVDLSSGKS
ncbi:MAG: TOBE domain-containing protein, partial [Desulfobacteraceae bacterium]